MPPYRRGRRVAKKSKKPVELSPQMKTAIKKVVAPAEEVKYIAKAWGLQSVGADVTTAAGFSLYNMIPDVSQGVAANNRIGNTINPKQIKTHFTVYFPSGTSMTANVFVRFLCVSSREIKDYVNGINLTGQNLFLDGAGGVQDITSSSFSQNLNQYQFLPVNRQNWIVHHDKTVQLRRNHGLTNNDTTSGQVPNTSAPLTATFCFNTPHKGALKYDKPADVTPNNFPP